MFVNQRTKWTRVALKDRLPVDIFRKHGKRLVYDYLFTLTAVPQKKKKASMSLFAFHNVVLQLTRKKYMKYCTEAAQNGVLTYV